MTFLTSNTPDEGRHVLQGNAPPSAVEEVWSGEFRYLYERVGRGLLT